MITGCPHFKAIANMQRNNTWTSSRRSTVSAAIPMLSQKFSEPTSFRCATTARLILKRPSRTLSRFAAISTWLHPRPKQSCHLAKQITDLILWQIERVSRLFSGCFRHDPKQGNHREYRRPVDMNPDGSVELYDALGCITHAKNFMGYVPGLCSLMAMFPDYGKARFEIAFVYPSVDGSYNERKAKGCIVPRNRWIDNLTSRSACDALRPDGREFLNDPGMEFYVRCNSGHT